MWGKGCTLLSLERMNAWKKWDWDSESFESGFRAQVTSGRSTQPVRWRTPSCRTATHEIGKIAPFGVRRQCAIRSSTRPWALASNMSLDSLDRKANVNMEAVFAALECVKRTGLGHGRAEPTLAVFGSETCSATPQLEATMIAARLRGRSVTAWQTKEFKDNASAKYRRRETTDDVELGPNPHPPPDVSGRVHPLPQCGNLEQLKRSLHDTICVLVIATSRQPLTTAHCQVLQELQIVAALRRERSFHAGGARVVDVFVTAQSRHHRAHGELDGDKVATQMHSVAETPLRPTPAPESRRADSVIHSVMPSYRDIPTADRQVFQGVQPVDSSVPTRRRAGMLRGRA
ncbi:hypothetical protein BJ546DRAFT_947610 [Cryomyces antarcticus]